MSGCVLLLSGGVESALLLYQLVEAGEVVWPIFVDYGQRNAAQERAAATSLASAVEVELEVFDWSALGDQFRQRQRHRRHVPIPHRNLLLSSLAFSWAVERGATSVAVRGSAPF